MPRDLYLYFTATGSYWLPDSKSDHLIQTIVADGVFDQPLVDAMRGMVSPGDVYLDVGSNFGQTAVLMSKAVGPGGRVLAFEADPWIGQALSRNLKQNGCRNAEVFVSAVWDEPGKVLIYPTDDLITYESHGSYGIDPRASHGQQVHSMTIDSLGLERIDLMKVDVQGADLRALMGARESIARCRPRIVFEYEQQFDERFNTTWQDYLDFIAEIDYQITDVISYVNVLITPRTP